MKKLLTVIKFELSNFIENKSYMITTILIAAVIAIVMFIPRFVDLGLTEEEDVTDSELTIESVTEDSEDMASEEVDIESMYIIYDEQENFLKSDDTGLTINALNESFAGSGIEWMVAESVDEVKEAVENEEAEAGFVITSPTDYDYYVFNKSMFDAGSWLLEDMMVTSYQQTYCAEHNIKYEDVLPMMDVLISCNEEVLGKDAEDSYWYCYILVIVVFMIIIFYGVMIATAVTSEKSNRSIEVLVTSTKPTTLLFGKVFAGTIAAFLQVGIILLVALGGYALNADAWGHKLDMLLDINPEVLVTFGFFGIAGVLFYSFVYGALGALVSKTEDINKSSSGAQMIIMLVYFLVLFQMSNIDGTVMKVLSFLPVSSYSAMFIRVAMGEVAIWEIILSYVILVASTILMGIIGGKIYRMGTLRYGNPIKISAALKAIRGKNE